MMEKRLLENYIQPQQIDIVRQLLKHQQRFLISTHIHPDGDAIGSEMSWFYVLQELDKEVVVLNHDPLPDNYQFLDPDAIIQVYQPEKHLPFINTVDVCLLLDFGDWQRLRQLGKDLQQLRSSLAQNHTPPIKPVLVCIDHHPANVVLGDYDLVYPQASSTGEIIYLILAVLDLPIIMKTAVALYTALLTDTGSFHFSNTTRNSHFMAGDLISLGIDHSWIYRQVYESESKDKIKLFAELLGNLHFECDHHVIWSVITLEMLQRHNLEPAATEGIADFPRRIQGVEISILFMELAPALTKVSLRSKGSLPIQGLAQGIGGGGHPYAAGALVHKSLQETIAEVLGQVCNYYQTHRAMV